MLKISLFIMRNPSLLFLVFCAGIAFLSCQKDPDTGQYVNKRMHIEVIADNLHIPWGMGFLPNGDFLFCERNGKINIKAKGKKEYLLLLQRVVEESEGGLLGLAIDPDFENTANVFIYETVVGENRLVRLKLANGSLVEETILISGIPAAHNHDGGALRFGPDGFLYVGTGDAVQPNLSQDKNSLAGKILRVDKNGNPAPGNPFNNRIWSYGHRNVQGFDWDKSGRMFATEHGPSGEFGLCCRDEINLIMPGKNYGWPIASGGSESDTLTASVYQTGNEVLAPSGCAFIHGVEWGDWDGNLIVAALRGKRLVRFKFNDAGSSINISRADTLKGTYDRLRNVIQGPDGSILFSSSNGEDKIYRIYWD
jgi:glucose/arabinose dehydrogenase